MFLCHVVVVIITFPYSYHYIAHVFKCLGLPDISRHLDDLDNLGDLPGRPSLLCYLPLLPVLPAEEQEGARCGVVLRQQE